MSKIKDMEARARQDTHEKVCAERYGNIWEQLKEIKAAQAKASTDMVTTLAAQSVQYNDRFNGLSNRMWGLIIASLGGAIIAIAALVFFLLTRIN